MAYNISGKIMEHVPEVRFCEVFLDDGTSLDGDKVWAVSATDTDKFMSLVNGRYIDKVMVNDEYISKLKRDINKFVEELL